jgi:hypothetical protein
MNQMYSAMSLKGVKIQNGLEDLPRTEVLPHRHSRKHARKLHMYLIHLCFMTAWSELNFGADAVFVWEKRCAVHRFDHLIDSRLEF